MKKIGNVERYGQSSKVVLRECSVKSNGKWFFVILDVSTKKIDGYPFFFRLSKLVADYYTPKPSVRRSSMASMLKYDHLRNIFEKLDLYQCLNSDRKDYLQVQICTWDFLPLDLDNKDLIQVVYMILSQVLSTFDDLEALRVPSGKWYKTQNTWTP